MTPAEAVELLRSIRVAMSTREGREIAREIAYELRRADEEAEAADPVGHSVDQALARARRSDRKRAGKKGGAR